MPVMPDAPVSNAEFHAFQARLFDHLERQFLRIDQRFDVMAARFHEMDGRFDGVFSRFDRFETEYAAIRIALERLEK